MKGTIVTRPAKDGTRSYSAVYRAGGRQVWRTFAKRRDAEQYLTAEVKKVNDGQWEASARPMPFSEVLDRWLEDLRGREQMGAVKRSTGRQYRSMVSALRSEFGVVRTDTLDHRRVSVWRGVLAEELAAGTMSAGHVNNLIAMFRVIVKWARHPERRYIPRDPIVDLHRAKRPATPQRFLEPEEVQALLGVARPPYDTLILTAAYSGLRPCEVLPLRWWDVTWGDGAGGALRVVRRYYGGVLDEPKTAAGARVVLIPQPLVDVLLAYRVSQLPREPAPEAWLFPGKAGQPLSYNAYNEHFKALVTKSGLTPATPYSLRHGYGTLLIAQGEHQRFVADQLGHRDPSFTMRTYVHSAKRTAHAAMARLGAAMPRANTALTEQGKPAGNTEGHHESSLR